MKQLFRKATMFAAVAALTWHPILAQAQVAVGNANKIVFSLRAAVAAWIANIKTESSLEKPGPIRVPDTPVGDDVPWPAVMLAA